MFYCINSISTVNWKVDIADGTPIYLQICAQIKRAVAVGHLKAEEALPSVRQLALELTVNPNTVARSDVKLEVGQLTESVSVEATQVELQTEKGDTHSEIVAKQIVNRVGLFGYARSMTRGVGENVVQLVGQYPAQRAAESGFSLCRRQRKEHRARGADRRGLRGRGK